MAEKWGVWAIETSTYIIFWSINKTPFEISQKFYFVFHSMFASPMSSRSENFFTYKRNYFLHSNNDKKSGIFSAILGRERFRRKEIEINKIWHFIWMNFSEFLDVKNTDVWKLYVLFLVFREINTFLHLHRDRFRPKVWFDWTKTTGGIYCFSPIKTSWKTDEILSKFWRHHQKVSLKE